MRRHWADIVYALRGIRKNPGFSLTVILVLALGIGGNIAIFSIVNAALLRPLPYKDADRLMLLWGDVEREVRERRGASFPDYQDWRDQNRSFQGLAAYWSQSFTLTGAEERVQIPGEIVGAGYFSLLGVEPALGREFTLDEESKFGSAPVIVIGHDFWTQRLGANPSVIGTTLQFDATPYTVVGVMPAGFRGLTDQASVWAPPAVIPGSQQGLSFRGGRFFAVLGKLREGVTRAEAQAEMDAISRALEQAYSETNEKRAVEVASLIDETFGAIRPALFALLGAVGLVLMIACANVANLLLVRTESRQAEIAIRRALGALRTDLLKLLLTESLLLSFLGAAIGLLTSVWASDLILTASPIQLPSFVNVTVDVAVVLFGFALAILTGLTMGLMPAFNAAPSNLHDTLKTASAKATAGLQRRRFRNALVIGEVAMTFVLLVGAGLLIESFRQLSQVDPGFNPNGLLTLRVGLARESAINARAVLDAISSVPGVESATLSSDIPYTGAAAIFYTAEGQSTVDATNIPRAFVHRITPNYFRTLAIRLLQGRDFNETDRAGTVIVSEGVMKRFWPGQDAIGKRIKSGRVDAQSPWLEIVGVVADSKTRGLPNNPTADPDVYVPFVPQAQSMGVIIRTRLEPAALGQAVSTGIRRLDKLALISNIASMEDLMRPLTARSRFTGWLTAVFSIMALVLALVGIYGTMSYVVTERTREIGIRVAVGAGAGDILGMVLKRGLLLVGCGVTVGLIGSVLATRGLSDLLFGVSPTEPSVFITVSVLMTLTGALAALIPAQRAIRIDPIRALREE